ncbi:Meiosis-specific protein ASY1 [Linum grandiflorum]
MQTKKRVSGRNSCRENGNSRITRTQRKVSESNQVGQKKATDLITSSARKQKSGTSVKKQQEPIAATNLDTIYDIADGNTLGVASGFDTVNHEVCNGGATECASESIFSPGFHSSKISGTEIDNGVDFIKSFRDNEQASLQDNAAGYASANERISDAEGTGLSSEVSAIYLAMKNSKLECVDEHEQDPMSTDVCSEEEEYEEFDDFDPYYFIKNLPELSSVIPTFRRGLLPKQTRSCPPTTLVLDLDETLVHSSLEPCDGADFTFPVVVNQEKHTVYVRCRPHLRDFMDRVSCLFEIAIFTASQSIYAEQLLNVLDPKRKVFRHRVFRESCVFVDGNYVKDLTILGRDLARVIIIDNSPQAFGFQVDNGIPIESWFDDPADQELLLLLPFLESLVGVEDVRPIIARKFNLQQKVAAATFPSISSTGDPFESKSLSRTALKPANPHFCRHCHTKLSQTLSIPFWTTKSLLPAMVVAQKVKEAEITEQDSLLLTRNLLRIAIFNISYIRGLFPEKYFTDKNVPALGVYDALQKKYLKMLLFCVCEAIDGPMIEEYTFSFSYSDSDSQEVSMNVNRIGNKKKGGSFKCNSVTEVTPNQMRSSACKMVRTLVQLMRTLDKMPEERTILMKLLYYDDVTPADYEPPFFKGCSEEDVHNQWTKSPLKMEVGNVNSKHFVLALKASLACFSSHKIVKSVLDPCDDEDGNMEDNDVSLGSADSDDRDDSSDSDSEINQSQEDRYVVAPAGKPQSQTDTGMVDEDDTQDPEEDEQQLARVKDWIDSYHRDTVELTDILSSFTDISVALTEEIVDKLVKEGVLSKAGTDIYNINKNKVRFVHSFILLGFTSTIFVRPGYINTASLFGHQVSDYDFDAVKQEAGGQSVGIGDKTPQMDDQLYMKALYHTLPMTSVTIPKLQSKLDGGVSLTTMRKLMNKMTKDGYLEAKGNRRLGKRVIHSITTEKKLLEVKRALQNDSMDIDANEPQSIKKVPLEFPTKGTDQRDNNSTCGVLRSVGSDLTRMKLRSDMNDNGSIRTEQTVSKTGNTPTSRAEPVASRESFARGHGNEEEAIICSRSTQDKKARKASMVEDPILQFKRQKAQASL